jgi:hypothetical protein
MEDLREKRDREEEDGQDGTEGGEYGPSRPKTKRKTSATLWGVRPVTDQEVIESMEAKAGTLILIDVVHSIDFVCAQSSKLTTY